MSDDKVGAVMVVGGGISGMQSSLDLADSGFKHRGRYVSIG
jgi:heterodisulfide reductase subunit A-like polyferredoxin